MKNLRLTFIQLKASLFVLAWFYCLQPRAIAADTEQCLVLKQNSSIIGATAVMISKDHAKLVTRARNLTFLIDSTHITVFSPISKTFYESSIDAYPGPPMTKLMAISGLSSKDYTLVKEKPGVLLGHATCNYAIQRKASKSQEDIFTHKFHTLSAFTKTGVNPKLAMGVCKIYGLPPLTDLPAELVYEQFGPMVKGISTYSFQEQMLKTSEFKMPAGLKKVASEAALSKDEGIDELSRF